MATERQIYLLDPKQLSPETIAVTFARTSRSPQSFREIAAELTDEQSAEFHEKWVVGYGHSSVAEHAVLHLALENVSRLAVETIESNRLASYTEKSTRYQKWAADAFYIPAELRGHLLEKTYVDGCRKLFDAYAASLPVVRGWVEAQNPRGENEKDASYENRIRSQYRDVCRFLLPAASLANVGMTANARVLEHAIRKMLSHPLDEVRQIGKEVKQVAQVEVPTLVKYAEAVPYLVETAGDLVKAAGQCVEAQEPDQDWCRLVEFQRDGEVVVLAAALYRFGQMSFQAARRHVETMGKAERLRLAEMLLGRAGPFDIPLRELEYCSYTFEVMLDEGAYCEVKRHRMMTQTVQLLTTRLGYTTPRGMRESGFQEAYQAVMDEAAHVYERLYEVSPQVAAYIVPNGCHRRLLMNLNLRTAFHFCQLRAAPNAHFSVRRIALRIAEQIRTVHPALAAYMRLPDGETWQGIETSCL